MNWKAAIPNSFTLGNLLCGCLGIIACFEESMLTASIFIAIAGILDFFDGFVARALGVNGELGKQLDSLADAVTFGVLPGIMMFQWISISLGDYFIPFFERDISNQLLAGVGLLVALFSVLRLAIFNIDTKQSDVFIGVPTPANAVFIASFPLIMQWQLNVNYYSPATDPEILSYIIKMNFLTPYEFSLLQLLWSPVFHISVSLISAGLLVAPFPLLNFKFKNFSFSDNKHRYIFLALVIICIALVFLPYVPFLRALRLPFLDYSVIPIIILLYIVYSFILFIIKPRK